MDKKYYFLMNQEYKDLQFGSNSEIVLREFNRPPNAFVVQLHFFLLSSQFQWRKLGYHVYGVVGRAVHHSKYSAHRNSLDSFETPFM